MFSVNSTPTNKYFMPQGTTSKSEVELGVFCTNDMHGDVNRLSQFKNAHDTFKKNHENTPSMTLAAGDCLFGADKQRNSLMVKLFNLIGIDALALGNHEFAAGAKPLSDSLEKAEFQSVSANLELDEKCPLKERIKDKKLVKSAIFTKGGHKFAVIGASPFNSYINTVDKTVKPMELAKTIKAINDEAKEIEKQGVNKIILCSHVGYGEQGDLKIARETEGIDIIVGGHTHTEIDGVNTETKDKKHNLNLLLSKRNEPVIITQVGSMNKQVGYLDVVFDEKGVLKTDKIVNKLVDLNPFGESKQVDELVESELGKKVTLATVKGTYAPKTPYQERYEENPIANAFADAALERGKKYGAEVSLFNAASVRGGISDKITNYDVRYSMLPFNSNLAVVDISEKDLVDLLKKTAGSILTSKNDPQILRSSGIEYSVRNDKEYFLKGGKDPISELKINGREVDIKNPDSNKFVRTIINEYLFEHQIAKDILGKYKENSKIVGKEQEIFEEYLNKKGFIDTEIKEQRVKTSCKYVDGDDFRAAQKEVQDFLSA